MIVVAELPRGEASGGVDDAPQPEIAKPIEPSTAIAASMRSTAFNLLRRTKISRQRMSAGSQRSPASRVLSPRRPSDDTASVEMVTVAVTGRLSPTGPVPPTAKGSGEKLQVTYDGSVPHWKLTDAWYPLMGVMVMVSVAVWPRVTVRFGDETLMVKSAAPRLMVTGAAVAGALFVSPA